MPDGVLQGLQAMARSLEIIGAGTLVAGFIVASMHCVVTSFRTGTAAAIALYRKALGRVVQIGLEILVAATIIKTITLDPTFESIAYLAIMVVLRTVLGWTTSLEINGRWPWQKARPAA